MSTMLAADDLTALLRGAATAAGILPASPAPPSANDGAPPGANDEAPPGANDGAPPGARAGVPPGVSVARRRDGRGRSWLCAFNHGTAPATLPASGLDLMAGREIAGALDLPPGGIAVIRERTGRLP